MKINSLFTILCLLFYFPASAQNLFVDGKIETKDSIIIMFGDGNLVDTLVTNTGKFSFKRDLKHPELLTLVLIKPNTKEVTKRDFFVGRGKLNLIAGFSELTSTKVVFSNDRYQRKYEDFRTSFNPLVKVARSVIDSSYVKHKTEEEKAVYRSIYDRILQIEHEVAEQFVLNNTDNIVGAYVLSNYLNIEEWTKLDSLYNLFPPHLFDSRYLTTIKNKLKNVSTIEPGKKFPPFSIVTDKGQNLTSEKLKGKYVVLDFWGTWCAPCIEGLPRMKEYYHKYKNNLEIIGIACREKAYEWRAVIEEQQLVWPQTLNGKNREDLSIKYNIDTYPTKILIDPEGNLVQYFRGETKDFYKKIDILLSN
ncbi:MULTISPECIES: TlpA family protein disulfide reductase [unclassified Sphingobacterium]|uniref:TlpA family protein disulfide reductase n=1 Tax=unclassified Sphingobacterium TaxID=2609468 RepID=UPI0025F3AEEA|nr:MULTISPECIES: TlpA disulfide reductase family protein [unclassified Sphingobacterium]